MLLSETIGFIEGFDYETSHGLRIVATLRPPNDLCWNELEVELPAKKEIFLGKDLSKFRGKKIKVTVELPDEELADMPELL